MKKAKKISLIVVASVLALLFIVASVFASIFFSISRSETFDQNKLINANMKIEVYGDDGNLLSDKSLFNSQYISLSKIPKETVDAFISIEDKTFYSHNGINPKRIVKAILNNISKGKASQGASTISQQLIKNTHLSSEKTYSRKIKEISLALEMEKELSKDEILENYLNVIYYGNNIYGIENASQFYFSKSASELTLEEGATLAALIKSPGLFDPIQHKERCLKRRNLVLSEMEKDGKISQEVAQKARETDLVLKINGTFDRGQNTYSQGAIMEAEEILKMPAKQIAIGKYKIHTFFSKEKQDALKAAIDAEELGFDQAGISINNSTHGIEAFYGKSAYNVLKTKRQPGSTIKPLLVYAPALNENIISPATKILDEEININGYKPQNFEKTFRGHLSTREALSLSSNIPAVKILSYVGIPKAKRYATRLGIEFDENDNGYALALGGMTYGTNIKTLAAAYTTFANNGKFYGAKFIKKIEDENGKTIYEAKFVPDEVFREDSNYLMVSMMETSATKGTSKRLASLPFQIAGKSGTVGVGATNSDAFSVALTTKDTVATWVGDLTGNNIGYLTGGKAPTDMIKNYFKAIYKTETPKDFRVPSSITEVEIDALEYENNNIVQTANDFTPSRYKLTEVFSRFNLPKEKSTNFLKVEPATLNGKIVNGNYVFEFDAQSHITYELYRIENDENKLVKTFGGQNGKVTYTLPQSDKESKFFLVSKIKNFSTNEEVSSDNSNIVHFLGKEAKTTQISQKSWYI